MPDFNKGDFTQQGVNGHVNATVRLNEKRLVNIDLTSNEEAEGCTITGTVKDLLNDKVYGVGAGVSGNIEITENGENINVAPYATATVNVSGGSDNYLILPMTDVTWDGQFPGGALSTEPDLSFITDGKQVIIKLNVVAEDPEDNFSIVALGTYSHSVGPITEGFRAEAENNVLISLKHTYEGDFPWYLSVTVSAEPMVGTYQIGIVTDIPDPVS